MEPNAIGQEVTPVHKVILSEAHRSRSCCENREMNPEALPGLKAVGLRCLGKSQKSDPLAGFNTVAYGSHS